ncbi:hypothetical protein HID58_035357 [Brassica napus]|uniref:Replication factor A C-terminal domain-containing protein n=1 Tax=Brassica napus TaxID=3708 RepID=A0ABQ8C6S0_BRANA|nr:hypothetical protein HID58_035357 [Brassica napus]
MITSYGSEPKVVLITSINPKVVGGENVNVCVSLFDGLGFAFAEKMTSYGGEPKVVLITSINPKVDYSSMELLGPTTTLTLRQMQAKNVIHSKWLKSNILFIKADSCSEDRTLTVSELNQYVLSADPQVIEFLCTAKVTGIQSEKGWCYIGCASCAKKLVKEVSSFTCLSCDNNCH